MRVVVPFAAERPKTRLEGVLKPAERTAFSRAMLADVLGVLRRLGYTPEVLATAALDFDLDSRDTAGTHDAIDADRAPGNDAPEAVSVSIDDRALTPAVNAVLADTPGPVAVVMADLALATPSALASLFDAAGIGSGSEPSRPDRRNRENVVALAPGRGGGTNALVSTHPAFRVDYHGASFLDHRSRARAVGATLRTVDSFSLATDIDEPADLAEVLIHGGNRSRAAGWLRNAGFSLAVTDGRVGVKRSSANGKQPDR